MGKTNPAFLGDLARRATNLALLQVQQANPSAALPLLRQSVSTEVTDLQGQRPLLPEARRHSSKVPHSCGHRSSPHCQHHEIQRWMERCQATATTEPPGSDGSVVAGRTGQDNGGGEAIGNPDDPSTILTRWR